MLGLHREEISTVVVMALLKGHGLSVLCVIFDFYCFIFQFLTEILSWKGGGG